MQGNKIRLFWLPLIVLLFLMQDRISSAINTIILHIGDEIWVSERQRIKFEPTNEELEYHGFGGHSWWTNDPNLFKMRLSQDGDLVLAGGITVNGVSYFEDADVHMWSDVFLKYPHGGGHFVVGGTQYSSDYKLQLTADPDPSNDVRFRFAGNTYFYVNETNFIGYDPDIKITMTADSPYDSISLTFEDDGVSEGHILYDKFSREFYIVDGWGNVSQLGD